MEPHVDASVAALTAHREAIAGALAVAGAGAAALFVVLVRLAAPRWSVLRSRGRSQGPYRGTVVMTATVGRVPVLVRATAMSCFAYGHFFVPTIIIALITLRFDGIAVALIPGAAIAFATWISGWLLVIRAESAPEFARAAAVSSLVLNGAMLVLSLAHLGYVELASGVHECSSSLAFISLIFSMASLPQSVLMLTTIRKHNDAYARGPIPIHASPAS
jgi:hypothetical protein